MQVDNHESEIDYERLLAAINNRAVESFIVSNHASQCLWDGSPRLPHLHAVSRIAEDYADLFFKEADFYQQTYGKVVCRLAGMLHESMDAGLTFEDLVGVADEAVARTVAGITADRRLPRPKRIEIYANQVGLANEYVQIVELANLLSDVVRVRDQMKHRVPAATLVAVRFWLQEANEIFKVLGKIKESLYLAQPFVNLEAGLDDLWRRCRMKR